MAAVAKAVAAMASSLRELTNDEVAAAGGGGDMDDGVESLAFVGSNCGEGATTRNNAEAPAVGCWSIAVVAIEASRKSEGA
jgi:hypothetical protein